MNKYVKLGAIIVGTVFLIVASYCLGFKNSQKTQEQKLLENVNIEKDTLITEEFSRVYNSSHLDVVHESEMSDWRTYTNSELNISFLVPVYCGEPVINQFYQSSDDPNYVYYEGYYPDGYDSSNEGQHRLIDIVQGIFPNNCPIHSFTSATPHFPFEGGYFTRKNKIKDAEFNAMSIKEEEFLIIGYYPYIPGYITSWGTWLRTGFNLKSPANKHYEIVVFEGRFLQPFMKIMNSVEIR